MACPLCQSAAGSVDRAAYNALSPLDHSHEACTGGQGPRACAHAPEYSSYPTVSSSTSAPYLFVEQRHDLFAAALQAPQQHPLLRVCSPLRRLDNLRCPGRHTKVPVYHHRSPSDRPPPQIVTQYALLLACVCVCVTATLKAHAFRLYLRSSPGPDGLHCSAWGASVGGIARLYRVLVSVTFSALGPSWFNVALVQLFRCPTRCMRSGRSGPECCLVCHVSVGTRSFQTFAGLTRRRAATFAEVLVQIAGRIDVAISMLAPLGLGWRAVNVRSYVRASRGRRARLSMSAGRASDTQGSRYR